jgi:beta-lactamase regulating signal transducer with metallopeptidase domain
VNSLIGLALSNLAVAGVLALVAGAVGRCFRRPALTHALWVLVLLKLVTPPLVPVPIPVPLPAHAEQAAALPGAVFPREVFLPNGLPPLVEVPERVVEAAPAAEIELKPNPAEPQAAEQPAAVPPAEPASLPVAAAPLPATREFDWAAIVGGAWVFGSALCLILAARRIGQFQRLLRYARAASPEVQGETHVLAERLGVRRPEVWLVPGVLSPMMWVMGRCRRLLLPEHLLPRLTSEQRAALLAHELAHLRRGDPWVRHLELFVLALYWWCPLVWWARSELREAEEECCDAWVIWALPGSARAYALALVETVDFMADARPALPALASGFGHVHFLRRRLTMIMRGKTPRALTAWSALAVLGFGALLLPLLPTWAQAPRERERADNAGVQADEKNVIDALRKQFDSALKELQKMQAENERLAREIKRLERGMERRPLDGSKPAPAAKTPAPKRGRKLEPTIDPEKPSRPVYVDPFARPAAPSDLERRLAELERKLTLALAELQALRREVGQMMPPPVLQIPAPGQPGFQPPPFGYVIPLQKAP